MWCKIVVLCSFFVVRRVTSLDVDCDGNCSTGINKGYYANSGDFPYQLLVSWFDSEVRCSAVLITYSFALTSASCVNGFQDVETFWKEAVLYGGGMALLYDIGNITDTVVHPDYNSLDSSNDLALIKFSPAITEWNPVLAPVTLSKMWPGKDDIICKVSSWWQGNMTGKWTERLLWREILLRSCSDNETNKNSSDLMCSASAYGGTSPVYPKDVGSPVICNGVLTGLVPNSDEPGLITNLTYHNEWILNTMKTLGYLNTTIETVPPSSTSTSVSTQTTTQLQTSDSHEILKFLQKILYIVSNSTNDHRNNSNNNSKNEINNTNNKNDNKIKEVEQKEMRPPSDIFTNYTILPLNYVLFATMILLFIIVCYNTLFSVILVHCSRK